MTLPTPEQATPVETLRRNLADLISESKALRQDVKKDAAARRRENLVNLLLSAVGVMIIGLVLVVAWQGQHVSKQNNRIIHQIDSCTTPDGECYRQQQQRTSGVVQQLLDGHLRIETCAKASDTAAELEACAQRRPGG